VPLRSRRGRYEQIPQGTLIQRIRPQRSTIGKLSHTKLAFARQTLTNLTQALERIGAGTFGECVQCGNDIELRRLEAIPWARYCLKCQELRENR
jgi:RNA polymerase-binding transcription factor DksA